MDGLYLYNAESNTLHIRNGCCNARGKQFASEDDALKYAGRRLGMCITCARKRDEVYRESLKRKGK